MAKKVSMNSPEHLLKKYAEDLQSDFDRRDYLIENGGTDPNYTDGFNINFKRRHIIIKKKWIEEICKEHNLSYPEIYFRETPDLIDDSYMAKTDEIKSEANSVYEKISEYPAYLELLTYEEKFSEKELKSVHYYSTVGMVTRLKKAIEENHFLNMRTFSRTTFCYECLDRCLERIKALIPEPVRLTVASSSVNTNCVQLSLFDL